jgi:hypothetical protein
MGFSYLLFDVFACPSTYYPIMALRANPI